MGFVIHVLEIICPMLYLGLLLFTLHIEFEKQAFHLPIFAAQHFKKKKNLIMYLRKIQF